jgi:hypothetical protein
VGAVSGGAITTLTKDALGYLPVRAIPAQVFNDEFDSTGSLDTANNWTAPTASGGGVIASTGSGNLTLGTGTTAAGYSYLMSQLRFRSSTPGWIRYAFNVAIADGAAPIANAYRYWGSGIPGGATVQNGAGFEVTNDGRLCAVVYSNAVRTEIADLGPQLRPRGFAFDGLTHNYQILYRPTKIYWYMDNGDFPVAVSTLSQSALNVDSLPTLYLAVAGATAPASSGVISSNAVSVSDLGANNVQISDGTYPGRKLAINAAGAITTTAATRAGTALDAVGAAAAGAQVTASLAAAAGATTNLTGFELTWDTTGAVLATSDVLTLAGTATALTWKFGTLVAVGDSLVVEFPQAIPASAVNTAITLSSGTVANRAGLSLVLHGFRV